MSIDLIQPSITFHVDQQKVAPATAPDGVDRVLTTMQRAYAIDFCDEREALLRGMEQLREELAPTFTAPRRSGHRVSQKARRRTIAALDHFIAQARTAKQGVF